MRVFLIYLVGMVTSIENTICRVSTDHDNWWNRFKNKICFVIKWFWGDSLEVTCTFLTTCTVNNTKNESSTKEINIFGGKKVSHLALESKADSN